jgi:hypothetical protein
MVAGGIAVLSHHGNGSSIGDTTSPASGPATSAATTDPNLVAGPGHYYYWKITGIYPEKSGSVQVWYGWDGSGILKTSSGIDPAGKDTPTSWGAGQFPYGDDLSGLSTDPAVLVDQLRSRSAPGGPSPQPAVTPLDGQRPDTGGLVRAISDLLTDAPQLLPEQRQAMYRVLVDLPTAEDLGSAVDPGGRPAVAVRIVTTDGATTFYFDPDTHLFTAEKLSFESNDPSIPSETWYVMMEAGGIAESATSEPSPDQRFFPDAERLPEASGSQEVAPSPVP